MKIQQEVNKHPAKQLLQRVMKTKAWSQATISEQIARGSHKSCDEHLEFLREEMLEFDRKGFWLVLPAAEV